MYENINVRVGADISQFVGALSRATQELEGFSKKLASIDGAAKTASDAMNKTAKETQTFADTIKKNRETFEAVGKVGKAVTAGGLAIAGGLGLASKSAIDFESAFAGVRKTVDASEAEFAALERGIRDMAKELPASAIEIAGVAEAAGQLGIETPHILKFTRVMIDLGEATNMSAETAATSLARFANIVQMPMENIDRLGSTIVALGNNLATTESEIVEMGLRLAGAGHQIGLTEAQILSFAGALSSVGIEAEAGGSAFSRVMITMANAVQSGGKELAAFAKVAGMSASDFRKAFQEDAAGALVMFIEGLARMSAEGENVFGVLEDLGLSEIRVRDALLRAAGAGDLFRESLELGSQAWEENTALTNEAEQRYQTLASQLAMLKNTIIDAAISIGQALMPAIRGLTNFLRRLVDGFNKLPEPLKASIAVLMTLGTAFMLAIGPMLILVGMLPNMISGFQLLAKGFAAIKGTALMTAGVFGIVIAVIAALAGGFVYLYKTQEGFRDSVDRVVAVVKDGLIKAFERVRDLATAVGEKFREWSEVIGPKVASVVERIGEGFRGLVSRLSGVGSLFGDIAKNAVTNFAKNFESLESIARWGVMLFLSHWLTGIPKLLFIGAKVLPAIAEGIQNSNVDIAGIIAQIFDNINAFLQNQFPVMLQAGVDAINSFVDGLTQALPAVVETAVAGISSFVEGIAVALPTVVESGATVILGLVDGLAQALPVVINAALDVLLGLVTALTENLPIVVEAGINVLTSLIDGITQALPLIIGAVIMIFTGFITSITENIGIIIEAGISILTALIEGITSVLPVLLEAAIMLLNAVVDVLITNLPIIIDAGIQILIALVDGIISILPTLVDTAILLIITFFDILIQNLPKIIDAGIRILLALIDGIAKVLPQLVQAAIMLIVRLAQAIIQNLPKIIDAGVKILKALIDGIKKIIPQLLRLGWQLVKDLARAVIDKVPDMFNAGKDLIKGLWNGINSVKDWILGKIKGFMNSITGGIKKFFGIKSPSRLFRDEIGKWLPLGLVEGIYRMKRDVEKATKSLVEWATPDVPDVSIAYSTPAGTFSSISSAIHGTIDVDTRDEVLVQEIRNLRRAMHGMRVVMDGREVGWLVEPHVTERQEFKTNINRSFRG